jgi:hypothetical protein
VNADRCQAIGVIGFDTLAQTRDLLALATLDRK